MALQGDHITDLWAAQRDVAYMQLLVQLVKDAVPQPLEVDKDKLIDVCKWFYEYNGAGGWLHVVLDDGNTEDVFVDAAIHKARDEGDIVCYLLALLLRALTEDERDEIYNNVP